jgi:hypothetical protein
METVLVLALIGALGWWFVRSHSGGPADGMSVMSVVVTAGMEAAAINNSSG